jgi:hypothetical protein
MNRYIKTVNQIIRKKKVKLIMYERKKRIYGDVYIPTISLIKKNILTLKSFKKDVYGRNKLPNRTILPIPRRQENV